MISKASLSYNIDKSNVLLVGVSTYFNKNINNLPNIDGNLRALKDVFSNPKLIGFPEKNIHILNNPTLNEFTRSLHNLVKITFDTLFFYYSGHAMYYNDILYFTFKDTDLNYLITTAIEYEDIEKIIKDGTQLHKKIIIIDSCFSGKVTEILSNYSSLLEMELKGLSGAYILTSSPPNRPSKSLPGKGITEFTESLVKVLTEGVDCEYPCIWDEILFSELNKKLKEKSELRNDIYQPKQLKTFNGSFNISFNPNYSGDSIKETKLAGNEKENTKITIKAFADAFYKWIIRKDLSKQLYLERLARIKLDTLNKDFTDSLNYAKRIQSAMLSSERILSSYLKEWFIYLQPRDIVSGDFYWFKEKNEKLYIVVADATGHGVPGAFMTILGINLLNELINTQNNLSTDWLLLLLRENIINNLFQYESAVRDGLDISLCCIDKEKQIIEFSGAYQPLYYFQKSILKIIPGDRMPVGYHEIMNDFTKHIIQYDSGDSFYIFTDGYRDQFGGPNNEKFKPRRFRHLFMTIQTKSMNVQKDLIIKTMETWKGESEQIDDILMIGFRL